MATDTYEVLADEYTVHKQIGELTDPITGAVTGVQQGSGKVYLKGDVLSAADVSPLIIEALEDEDNPNHDYVSKRLVKSSEKANVLGRYQESVSVPVLIEKPPVTLRSM